MRYDEPGQSEQLFRLLLLGDIVLKNFGRLVHIVLGWVEHNLQLLRGTSVNPLVTLSKHILKMICKQSEEAPIPV
jgi:hypothetical protein